MDEDAVAFMVLYELAFQASTWYDAVVLGTYFTLSW